MIEPIFKVGDVLHRCGYVDHRVVSIFENKVYVCEIDDDGPCESHISVEDQDKWSLTEIPYMQSDIVHIDNNGHAFTPDWANRPVNDGPQNCSLDSLIGNLVQDVVANEHDHDTFGDEKKPSKYFIEKYLPMFEAFIKKEEPEKPKHSYISNVYHVGSEPTFKVGDVIAYYFFYSDSEGEHIYGTITKIEWDDEEEDWVYYFYNEDEEDDGGYPERYLIEEEAYRINNRKK